VLVRTISHIFSPALDAALMAFKARYPDVELVLETAHSERIIESAHERKSPRWRWVSMNSRTPICATNCCCGERQPVYCGRTHELFGRTIDDPASWPTIPSWCSAVVNPWRCGIFAPATASVSGLVATPTTCNEAGWLIGLGIASATYRNPW